MLRAGKSAPSISNESQYLIDLLMRDFTDAKNKLYKQIDANPQHFTDPMIAVTVLDSKMYHNYYVKLDMSAKNVNGSRPTIPKI